MLVLTRKPDESILLGNIVVTILRVNGDKVRIGIRAPAEVPIVRAELPPKAAERPSASQKIRDCA